MALSWGTGVDEVRLENVDREDVISDPGDAGTPNLNYWQNNFIDNDVFLCPF